ncbi:unnamed protein product [Closterium sp. Naga37s-1]|nr:unnamed protein product [Closterium sp. Naga37s-1]
MHPYHACSSPPPPMPQQLFLCSVGVSSRRCGSARERVAVRRGMAVVLHERRHRFPPISFIDRSCQQVEFGKRAGGSHPWVLLMPPLARPTTSLVTAATLQEREKQARKKAAAAGVPYVEGAAEAPAEGDAPDDTTRRASAAEETSRRAVDAAANSKGDAGKGGEEEEEAGLVEEGAAWAAGTGGAEEEEEWVDEWGCPLGGAGLVLVMLAIIIAYFVQKALNPAQPHI